MSSAWYTATLDDSNWQFPREEERAGDVDIHVASWPMRHLAELVGNVDEARVAEGRPPLITPRDIEPETGDQVPREHSELEPVFQVHRQLVAGDILLPRASAIPAVLVSEAHARFAFSTGFVPVRPNTNVVDALFLWMLLSSSRGIRARANLSPGNLDWDAARRLRIAVPPLAVQRTASVALPNVRWLAAESRWRTANLRSAHAWGIDRADIREGDRLRDIAQIRDGAVDDGAIFAVPGTSRVPVLTAIKAVEGRPDGWATIGPEKVSDGSEIALSPVFPFRACRLPAGWVASRRFLVLRIVESLDSPQWRTVDGLVTWINSIAGKNALGVVASGAALPRLTAAALGRVAAPDSVAQSGGFAEPLADQLERALGLL